MKRILQCCKRDDRLDDSIVTPNEPRLSSVSTLVVSHETNGNINVDIDPLPPSLPKDVALDTRQSFTLPDEFSRSESGFSFSSSLDGLSLMRIGEIFENGMKISDHKYHFRTYPKCFVAREAVDFLVKNKLADSRKHAVHIGNALMKEYNMMEHVCRQHSFKDDYLFFQFVPKRHRFVSIQDEVGCYMHTYGNAMLDYESDDGSLGSSSLYSASSFQNLSQVAEAFEASIETRDQRYHFQTYKNVFIGSDAVDHMVISGMARSRHHAVELGRALTREFNLFRHVLQQHEFRDDYLFYCFTPRQERFSRVECVDESVLLHNDKQRLPLHEVASLFEKNVPIKDHMYRLKVYKKTFVGSKAVDYMVKSKLAQTRKDAVRLGRRLVHLYNLFEHVCNDHDFQDDYYFYRFVPPERRIVHNNEDPQEDFALSDNFSESGSISSVATTSPPSLLMVANAFRKGVHVRSHTWRFKTYRNSFIASEAVDFLINSSFAQTRREAVALGRKLASDMQLFEHVTGDHSFKDDYLFFQFTAEPNKKCHKESFDMTGEPDGLHLIAQNFRANVKVADNKYHMKTYRNTFIGREAVDFLVQEGLAATREHAVQVGRQIAHQYNLFEHCLRQHEFKDSYLFYRFVNMGELSPMTARDDIQDDSLVDLRELHEIAEEFEAGVRISDNRHHLRVYKNTFIGSEAVDFLVARDPTKSREEVVQVGQLIARAFNLFEHVCRQHPFKDENLFFRFNPPSERYVYDLDKLAAIEESADSSEDENDGPQSFFSRKDRSKSFSLPAKSVSLNDVQAFRAGNVYRRASMPVRPATAQQKAQRVKNWSSTFRRVDPRYQILSAVNTVVQDKAYGLKEGVDRDVISNLLRGTDHAPLVFSIWRPTSFDAIRRMMLGEGTGKGLDIKGKSAKRGKLSGFVPFLQINENRHKYRVRTLPKDGRVRLFFKTKHAREIAGAKLETVAQEMIEIVQKASKVLSNDRADKESHRDALKSMFLDVSDPSIFFIDDYAPQSYGMNLPVRLFWEAFFIRQDCTRKAGSEFDTGRNSVPAFQDMNFASLRNKSTRDKTMPKAVVLQYGTEDPLSPFEFVMAYEEHGRVLPVVSDFDCFLVGTRNVKFSSPLPPDQLEVLTWCVDRIEEILESPPRPSSWTSRWLEVLKKSASDGFHPKVPRLGFGDPVSYNTMENAIKHLTSTAGPVRHGSESFNYYFPQDLDEEYLVISDTAVPGNLCWKYLNVEELQDFLHEQIDDGYTFPLNPKTILCDAGRWKELYDKLIASDVPDVQESMNVWYPEDSGLREKIEDVCARHPEGFQRESYVGNSSERESDSNCLSHKTDPNDSTFKIAMDNVSIASSALNVAA